MRISHTANELVIDEAPGCLWIFGLFFAFVGGVFVYGALGGLTDYERHEFWMLALAFLMGSVAVGTGLWIIYGAPITKVVVDRIESTVLMTRYGLFGKRETFYGLEEIERFCLVEEKDSEGDSIWSLGMDLTNGERIKISSLPNHDERFKSNFVFQINEFINKQISPAQMILELEDEPSEEMR